MFSDPADRFYPIIDTGVCARHAADPREVAAACLRGGARVLQLRVKAGSSAGMLALADDVAAAAAASGAALIVNDRADVALACGARGVHVGQEDLPPEAVRRTAPRLVIGLSTHDERQVDGALVSAADYVAVGPIFGTATKDTGYGARGLSLIRYAGGRGKPIVAIGGVTLENAAAAREAGAGGLAVISDLFTGGDVERRARAFVRALTG